MTCKRENNILCNSNGSHLSGQTRQKFFCSSACALSLPSSLQYLWVIRKVLWCHSKLQAWHRPSTVIPVPWSLHVHAGGRGTTTDPPSASHHTSINTLGQAFFFGWGAKQRPQRLGREKSPYAAALLLVPSWSFNISRWHSWDCMWCTLAVVHCAWVHPHAARHLLVPCG